VTDSEATPGPRADLVGGADSATAAAEVVVTEVVAQEFAAAFVVQPSSAARVFVAVSAVLSSVAPEVVVSDALVAAAVVIVARSIAFETPVDKAEEVGQTFP